MSSGIYAYWDNVRHYYVYVGKDNNINKKSRHNDHIAKCNYDKQQINRVLQNNPERYEYRIIMSGDYNNKQLEKMEKLCIKSFKTFREDYPERNVFNFTRGGEGTSGWHHSNESKEKISKSCSENCTKHWLGKAFTEEHRKKISDSKTGKCFTEEHKKNLSINHSKYWQGKKRPDISKRMSGNNHPGAKYKIWNNSIISYKKSNMFSYNGVNKPRKVFRLRYNRKEIPIGGFIDFTTPEIIHDLICEAIDDYNE